MIPQNIERNFEAIHINMVWEELEKRFGFNVKEWKKSFKEQLSSQPRSISEVEFFLRFGNRHLNNILNQILCRNAGFPTFNRLVDYILERENKPKRRSAV